MNPAAILGFLSPRGWAYVGVALAVVVGLLWFGHARYQDGVRDADERWEAASARLVEQAAKSGTQADRREALRLENNAADVKAEKEKIDEAVAAGASPLDVLFGGV